jgi:rod shape-determining protein MreD
LIVLFALIQGQFLPGLLPSLNQTIPDLTLLLVVSWALLLEWTWALPLAFLAGLALDLIGASLYPVGFEALLFVLVAFPVTMVNKQGLQGSSLRSIPIALFAAVGYRLLMLLAGQVLGYNNFQISNIFQVVLTVSIIDAALMLVVFLVVSRLSRVGSPRD